MDPNDLALGTDFDSNLDLPVLCRQRMRLYNWETHHDRIGPDLVGADMMGHPALRTMDLDYGKMPMAGIAGTVAVAPVGALADMVGVVGAGLDKLAVDVDNEVSDEAREIIDWGGNLVPANKDMVGLAIIMCILCT